MKIRGNSFFKNLSSLETYEKNPTVVQVRLGGVGGEKRLDRESYLGAGLPNGLFSNQKSKIWVNFGGPLNG
jgi:hypothetical protein